MKHVFYLITMFFTLFETLPALACKEAPVRQAAYVAPPALAPAAQFTSVTPALGQPAAEESTGKMIKDWARTLPEVEEKLREEGLESSSLIIAIDFTKSNTWTGNISFRNQDMHTIDPAKRVFNFYELAISIMGKTLENFDDDKKIPCYGFGSVETTDRTLFNIKPGAGARGTDVACLGFGEVLEHYRGIAPKVNKSGPTSFTPAILQAIEHVKQSGGAYHILLIISDGEIAPETNVQRDIATIREAANWPLSIIVVGVGDGNLKAGQGKEWETMETFDDKIQGRKFDNFQFVNWNRVMAARAHASAEEQEAWFATNALQEIPTQYKNIKRLKLIGKTR